MKQGFTGSPPGYLQSKEGQRWGCAPFYVGQAIPRHGTALIFENGAVEIDSQSGFYSVRAGALVAGDCGAGRAGILPKVRQSNHDFGVAATISVNAHGWPVPFGLIGSTVRVLRMMLLSGDQVTCLPSENAHLFEHAMGGYGLIVDLDVEKVANLRRDIAFTDPAMSMAYGRLNVDRAAFFRKGLQISCCAIEE